jgi:exosortase D (VPLPA-CTERM-specific)
MNTHAWKTGLMPLVLIGTVLCVILLVFFEGLDEMVNNWSRDEYSHGYLLPVIAAYFIWQKKNELSEIEFKGSWVGVVVFCLGLLGFVIGELSTLYTVIQYSFLLSLAGLLLALMGWPAFRLILVPFCILFFMVPLPAFLYNNLSSFLQLISSQLGVWVIRLFGISVFLEGNVIDLGQFKLQVVEACSGLRYLFPLMSLGFIAAYLYRDSFWKKAVVFLSTIPITVVMNSFRIGVIGVMVEFWGQEMAEGFLHDFEGWVVFMACTAVLVVEMWLLSKIGRNSVPFSEVFAIDPPVAISDSIQTKNRSLPITFYVAFVLLIATAITSEVLPERREVIPERVMFKDFPLEIGGRVGKKNEMEAIYLDALKLSDYILVDYIGKDRRPVNFYVAYYNSQRKGVSAHSPKSCLPGGGWRIKEFDQKLIQDVTIAGAPLVVNRTVIEMGDVKQLVYYWFQQRSRIITNEYLVKWYLFWDALTKQRTDGALVRITTMVPAGDSVADSDKLLQNFARDVTKQLDRYIPE